MIGDCYKLLLYNGVKGRVIGSFHGDAKPNNDEKNSCVQYNSRSPQNVLKQIYFGINQWLLQLFQIFYFFTVVLWNNRQLTYLNDIVLNMIVIIKQYTSYLGYYIEKIHLVAYVEL